MKAKILLDEEKPKVKVEDVRAVVRSAGLEVGSRNADIGIVVGGDGLFGRFGMSEAIPLLFVGVRSEKATGSKAYLASAYFDELGSALGQIMAGRYAVKEFRRLEVLRNGKKLGEVFTDVYLQRGAESNCIRYRLRVRGDDQDIEETGIGDGVVVSTPAGSTGYYSYPDKIRGNGTDAGARATISEGQVGICHIVPTYTERSGSPVHPLRYMVPWGCRIELSVLRPADARLYGIGPDRRGVKLTTKDSVVIAAGTRTTKVISLLEGSDQPTD